MILHVLSRVIIKERYNDISLIVHPENHCKTLFTSSVSVDPRTDALECYQNPFEFYCIDTDTDNWCE